MRSDKAKVVSFGVWGLEIAHRPKPPLHLMRLQFRHGSLLELRTMSKARRAKKRKRTGLLNVVKRHDSTLAETSSKNHAPKRCGFSQATRPKREPQISTTRSPHSPRRLSLKASTDGLHFGERPGTAFDEKTDSPPNAQVQRRRFVARQFAFEQIA